MSQQEDPDRFVPRGAVASFAVMLAAYVCLWFGMYFLMVQRG